MENSKKWTLPLHHGINISKDLYPKIDDELNKISRVPYVLAIGSIMYVMTCTRLDVSFALSIKINKDDSQSRSGWVFLLNGRAMTWKSSKQDTVANSMCESRYIAACEASKEAIWMKNFIGDIRVVSTRPH
nr:hypothetical protein [Tanacetum cinerariifolium]